jgi:hypothetical protein
VWRGKSGAEREQRQLKEKRKEEKDTRRNNGEKA